MKVPISRVKITERIRKELTKIDELSADIEANGLLNPITVMRLTGGEYQLLAGLRRLRATEKLGQNEIDVNVVSPTDAEMALRIEISENEQREPFTFSEQAYYGKLLEAVENAKAKERIKRGGQIGGQGGTSRVAPNGATLEDVAKGKVSYKVGPAVGVSGRTYERIKHISDNAPPETIERLDKGEVSIAKAYNELRAKEKAAESSTDAILNDVTADSSDAPDDAMDDIEETIEDYELVIEPEALIQQAKLPETKPPQNLINKSGVLSKADEEAAQRNKEFNALPPEEKIVELQRQLKEERVRAAHAISELARLKELRHNDVYHRDGIIENLKSRLAAAEARVEELEKRYGNS